MNLFKSLFLDAILLTVPMLIYLIYLSTDKNMNDSTKRIYLRLGLLSSFFMIYNYAVGDFDIVSILIMSSVIILSYLEDLYVLANLMIILILISYSFMFNNVFILLLGYIIINILYLIKCKIKFNNVIFVQLCAFIISTNYFFWIYLYNKEFFKLSLVLLCIMCYILIANIICLMYENGKRIIDTRINYKELQKEEQIRLSLFKITHEIKNPISVCKAYLDMMNTKDTKQVDRYVPIIKSEIDRLLVLLQDFLLINKKNLDLDIMDFNLLIEDTIDKLKSLSEDSNIRLKLNTAYDEIFINGDYNRLSQVIINILKNSIEAIPNNKKGIINIKTRLDKKNCYLTIEDNGIGMDENTLSKMREPFFTTKKRGSGLGVSLIYEIVEAHDGKVEYESEYGKGTKVTIQIPLYNV